MTVAQLTVAWSSELAEGGEDPKQCEQNLGHILMTDIVNGRLDDSGPLWDGRRLGVACITPENKAGFAEGKFFLDLSRADPGRFLHYVLIMKEAVLDFARRHRLPPPSWWIDSDETPALSSSVTPAGGRARFACRRPGVIRAALGVSARYPAKTRTRLRPIR
jgi:hypothetical protein